MLVVGVYGPIAFAISTLVRAIALTCWPTTSPGVRSRREQAADDLLTPRRSWSRRARRSPGVLALGFWLVKGSLDAMRLGLLTRFMGVLGIALGPALVLGFGLYVLPLWLIAARGAVRSGSGRAECRRHG